jgi:hypothetical protein
MRGEYAHHGLRPTVSVVIAAITECFNLMTAAHEIEPVQPPQPLTLQS